MIANQYHWFVSILALSPWAACLTSPSLFQQILSVTPLSLSCDPPIMVYFISPAIALSEETLTPSPLYARQYKSGLPRGSAALTFVDLAA
jgi:hypothetical protein